MASQKPQTVLPEEEYLEVIIFVYSFVQILKLLLSAMNLC